MGDGILCRCGHTLSEHGIPALAYGDEVSPYVCRHTPEPGSFSMSAISRDCGCRGFSPREVDDNAEG